MLEMMASILLRSSLTAASFCRSCSAIALKVPASCPISSRLWTAARAVRSPAEIRPAARASSSTGAVRVRALQAPSRRAATTPATSASPSAIHILPSARSSHSRGTLTWTTPVMAPPARSGTAAKIRGSPSSGSGRIMVVGRPSRAARTSGATEPPPCPAHRPVAGGRPVSSFTPTYTPSLHEDRLAMSSRRAIVAPSAWRISRSRAMVLAWLRTSRW